MLGVYLSEQLDSLDRPTHLKFDCDLARGAGRNLKIRKGFNLKIMQKHVSVGEYNIENLKPRFMKMERKVLKKLIRYTRKKKWCDCFTSCFRDRALTFLFGCDYTIHGSKIVYKCAFENRKKATEKCE
ncbi:unnamed protein product [Cylicocyclus nassatus]|uniref:Uncharacterized protein n=1 Tax=Cylicocyclus nassatus TaxID=53992 RepID=A0AA36M5C9_CYLNA|nr:unnamed protein product [Cylicocyclus nassatus]